MPLISTAVIAGASALASIVGGAIKSARAKRAAQENQKQLDQMKRDNENYFNRYYNMDATQMADNRAVLTEAATRLRRNSQAAAGTNAVVGGTNATAAAAKEANNQAYADAVRGVAANAQQYKNNLANKHLDTKNNLAQQQMAVNTQRNDANAMAIDTAVSGLNSAASAYIAANGNSTSEKTNKTEKP